MQKKYMDPVIIFQKYENSWTFHLALTSFFYTGAVKEYNMYHYNMSTQNLQVLKGVKEKYFANT